MPCIGETAKSRLMSLDCYSMIPKSGNRFSEKIMLKQENEA